MRKLSTQRAARQFASREARPLVLVPTMGALHAGHRSLLDKGRKLAGPDGCLVATIFLNPTQFGPGEDLKKYPRTLPEDLKVCRAAGVDAVFVPSAEEMYARDHSISVEETRLSPVLCGASRPGHFRGVCTIVAKLFLLFAPDAAIFGRKDWQQLAVIRRMVRDLNFPIRIVGHATVREKDGLALSSRNRLLDPASRAAAPAIYAALRVVQDSFRAGQTRVEYLQKLLLRNLRSIPGADVDYAEIVDASSLDRIQKIRFPATALVAVRFGKVRLIDNLLLRP